MAIDRLELERALAHMYGPIYRIAHALCGRQDLAARALNFVVGRGVGRMDRWKDEMDAQRWFLHHTILAVRRYGRVQSVNGASDPLIANGPAKDMAYGALVRAIRALPPQQEEAVILHFCSHLNSRFLALGMDCSVGAAEVHLESGTTQLRAIAGEQFEKLVEELAHAYKKIGPAEWGIPGAVRRMVNRHLRTRRLANWAKAIAWTVGIAGAGAAAAWGMGWISV